MKTKKRISKAEWMEKALEILEIEGIAAVKIERLAKELGTSRSGFYWHFRNRRDLLNNILVHWRKEYTEIAITKNKARRFTPQERLSRVMEMIEDYDLDRYEVHIRAWADHDPEAAGVVAGVYRLRFEFIRSIFAEMGFAGINLEMRARLWLCHATHGKSMFGEMDKKNQNELLKQCHAILTCKPKDKGSK